MNFPPGFDPSMIKNVNADQMKMASDMLSGMSDEQLQGYAKMMGFLHQLLSCLFFPQECLVSHQKCFEQMLHE